MGKNILVSHNHSTLNSNMKFIFQVVVGALSVCLVTQQCAGYLTMFVKVIEYRHVQMIGNMYGALKLIIRIILFPFCRRNVA
jgi:hypothetical protein